MKNRIKYLILSLFVVVTLALCACGKKVPEDISTKNALNAESYLKQVYEMSENKLYQTIEEEKNHGQDIFVGGYESFIDTREKVGELDYEIGRASCRERV